MLTVQGLPPISLEQNFAKRNNINIGDTMTFNVQGAIMQTVVGSISEVDWRRIRTNFLVVFPNGLIDDAPQFNVYVNQSSVAAGICTISTGNGKTLSECFYH